MYGSGNIVSEGVVVDLVDENAEERGSLLARVRLELRLNAEDESRSDGGKQTGL